MPPPTPRAATTRADAKVLRDAEALFDALETSWSTFRIGALRRAEDQAARVSVEALRAADEAAR